MEYILNNKIQEKSLSEVTETYITPRNIKTLCVPRVNPQIWDALKPNFRQNDSKLQKVENLLIKGITAVARSSSLTEGQEDGLTCMASAVHELNTVRREFMKPGLSEKFRSYANLQSLSQKTCVVMT